MTWVALIVGIFIGALGMGIYYARYYDFDPDREDHAHYDE
jgi:hypothetical protein